MILLQDFLELHAYDMKARPRFFFFFKKKGREHERALAGKINSWKADKVERSLEDLKVLSESKGN